MLLLLLLLLSIFTTCSDAFILEKPKDAKDIYSVIAMSSHVCDVNAYKNALLRAYNNHIASVTSDTNGVHKVALIVDTDVVLTWTDSAQEETLTMAVHNLPLVVSSECGSQSFADILDTCRSSELLEGKATNVYLIVDNVKDSATNLESYQAAQKLIKEKHAQVYPLGIGPCVETQQLKRIAGPCHPLFGCHAPFAYYQSTSYEGIKRAAAEQRQEQQEQQHSKNKRHTITTTAGLTGTQIAITIVFAVLIGVLAMWCLVYSCCYLPKQIPEYTMWAEEVIPQPMENVNTAARVATGAVPSFVSSFRKQKVHIV